MPEALGEDGRVMRLAALLVREAAALSSTDGQPLMPLEAMGRWLALGDVEAVHTAQAMAAPQVWAWYQALVTEG